MKNSPVGQPTGEVRRTLEYIARVLVFVVLYFAVGKLCLSLGQGSLSGQGSVSALWPPAGMALVLLLMLGYKMWPGIFLGSLLVGATRNEALLVAAGAAVGATLEALVATYLLKEVFGLKNRFDRPRDALAMAIAAFAGSAVAGLIGPFVLVAGRFIPADQWRATAIIWWFGDLMGILVFGTFLLVIFDRTAFRILKNRGVEAGVILALIFAVSVIILTSNARAPITYLLFPFVMLAAVRLTQVGVVSSVLVINSVAIWALLSNLGPFSRMSSSPFRLIDLEFYLSVLTATSMILAMAIQERMRIAEKLRLRTVELDHLQRELKDANLRVTNILTGILDESSPRRGSGNHARAPVQQHEES